MAVYGDIPNPEIDIDEAVKSSTAKKFRDNPLAVTQGDPTAKAAGEGVAIEFDFGAGSQTSIITDELNTDKSLTPDGAGGAKWTSGVSGMILVERKEIAVAVTRVDFLGLNGNVDEVYRLVARINKPISATTDLIMTVNGGVNLDGTRMTENGVTRTDTIGRFHAPQAVASAIQIDMLIHARQVVQALNIPRMFQGKVTENQGVAIFMVNDFAIVDLALGNYTSIELGGPVGGIGVGSTFELFKLSQ